MAQNIQDFDWGWYLMVEMVYGATKSIVRETMREVVIKASDYHTLYAPPTPNSFKIYLVKWLI